jgi:hypothetical protein
MIDDEFNIVELLEERGPQSRQHSRHKVAPRFKRTYSTNPLVSLIRQEERGRLRQLSVFLKGFLSDNLELGQYGFLHTLLGKGWETHDKLPLEFKDMGSKEFETFLATHLDEIKERIDILREHYQDTSFDGRSFPVQEFISVPYNMATRSKIIEIYEGVASGSRPNYPSRFFDPRNARIPRILTRHLVDDILHLPHASDLPDKLQPRDFSDHNLAGMLGQYFSGNVERALRHAYSMQEFSTLYQRGYETRDVLREVFTELDKKLHGKKTGESI